MGGSLQLVESIFPGNTRSGMFSALSRSASFLAAHFSVALRFFAVLALAFGMSTSMGVGVTAADADPAWPQFRGMNRDSVVPAGAVPMLSTHRLPRLLWRRIIGEGYSGFVAAEGRAYTLCQTVYGQYLLCLDMNSGGVVWQTWLGLPVHLSEDYPGPYSTPAISDGRVLFVDCSGRVGCADARNGTLLWKTDMVRRLGGQCPEFGFSASPLVENGRLYLPAGGSNAAVVCLDVRTGALIWGSGSRPASYASCYPITIRGHRQVVTFLQNAVVAHDPETGVELWSDVWEGQGYEQNTASPVYQEPYLLCASPFHQGARVLKLDYTKSGPAVERAWRSEVLSCDMLSPVVVQGFVYGFDVQGAESLKEGGTRGEFKCVELATGRQRWATRAPGHASVLVWGETLVLLNESGELIFADASPDDYRERLRARVINARTPCWTSPILYKGRLLIRNQRHVACYDLASDPPVANPVPAAYSADDPLSMQLLQEWTTWAENHQSPAFWKPDGRDLMRWYFHCLLVLLIAVALARLVRGHDRLSGFLVLAFALGLVAMPLLSYWRKTLIFTWPVMCHAAVALLMKHRATRSPAHGVRTWFMNRLWLVAFAGFCVAYTLSCLHLRLISGIGFLIGFGVAACLPVACARAEGEPSVPFARLPRAAASFTAYYWTSAALAYWMPRWVASGL